MFVDGVFKLEVWLQVSGGGVEHDLNLHTGHHGGITRDLIHALGQSRNLAHACQSVISAEEFYNGFAIADWPTNAVSLPAMPSSMENKAACKQYEYTRPAFSSLLQNPSKQVRTEFAAHLPKESCYQAQANFRV